jgi:predicted nucleotidyltransferase
MHPLIENNLETIRALCVKHKVLRLYLIGSAFRDDFKPCESDVDFLVEFKKLGAVDYLEAYFGLEEDLEKLLEMKVDMTMLNAVKNPYFLKSINRNKKEVFYAA